MLFNLLQLLLLVISVTAHNVLLPAYGKRCFIETLHKGDILGISFQFGDRFPESSAQLTGDLIMYGSTKNEILKSVRDVTHGDESITAMKSGTYEFCFSNEASGITTKDVTFNVHGTKYVDADGDDTDTLEGSVNALMKLVHEVRNEQEYLILRERTHRNTAESTNERVKWWSIFQLVFVIFNALFQIFYLKRFFEVTSVV
ncbi:hypothetical protein TPHA_0H00270 [Tetrapisispora phaffii CBS 4417]|uniref:GOLD domain-containing protein n=1 Tax=Tetrapisispora phaffii (strain ATCC 24235 / CBS 4417 / NBRC 1672 / NRRL Y-8282 / UCD 70-5) TaxID=1071381 RepID=G8BWT3_TETPH|nr:hypothetical protein TPHA_0H00270 [Tetrapisispora phaffii CBS 4417]CCE64237.1 hypothetical protein TPHA_0H00270 [Tetrapisispora phaffii CBS 4417]